jgi:uncharacterized small protein (DUF1192 family)
MSTYLILALEERIALLQLELDKSEAELRDSSPTSRDRKRRRKAADRTRQRIESLRELRDRFH